MAAQPFSQRASLISLNTPYSPSLAAKTTKRVSMSMLNDAAVSLVVVLALVPCRPGALLQFIEMDSQSSSKR